MESHLQTQGQIAFIKTVEHIVDKNFIYIIRPYWNHGNLIESMRKSKVNLLTENEIGKRAHSICKALEAIHEVGYLHGDVRP